MICFRLRISRRCWKLGNHVRVMRERKRAGEGSKRERESCDLLNRSRSYLFSVALPIESEPGLPTLVTRQIPFCHSPLLTISYFCHCRIPSRAGGEAFSTLLRCASANNKSIVAKVKSGSAQARKPLHRHLQLAPLPQHPRERDPRLAALETSTAVNASKWKERKQEEKRKTQSEPESKMLIKLIELSLSSGAEHTHTQSARPNGSLILGAKGFLQ